MCVWWMMAFVVHEVVWTLLYVVFIDVVVGELGGMFLGGIAMYYNLHYSRAPWRPPQKSVNISIVVCTRFPTSGGAEFTRGGDAVFPSRLSTSTFLATFFYVCSLDFQIVERCRHVG